MTIRESANDGSDFTNPAADYRRLFLGEDGGLHLKDSSGTVTDIAGGGGGTVNDDLPWSVEINPLGAVATQTNWATIVSTYTAGALYQGWARESTGAQNAEVGWDVVLAAGTWTFDIFTAKQTNFGIVTVSIDASSVGTIDLYNNPNQTFLTVGVLSITGISVATAGKKRLLLKMATKNGSSSNYYCDVSWVRMYRTA